MNLMVTQKERSFCVNHQYDAEKTDWITENLYQLVAPKQESDIKERDIKQHIQIVFHDIQHILNSLSCKSSLLAKVVHWLSSAPFVLQQQLLCQKSSAMLKVHWPEIVTSEGNASAVGRCSDFIALLYQTASSAIVLSKHLKTAETYTDYFNISGQYQVKWA